VIGGRLFPWLTAPAEYLALRRADRALPERLRRARKRRLARMLHAALHSPYYAQWLPDRAAIDADPLAVLQGLPVLDKAVIRAQGARLCTGLRRLGVRRNTSGGSTGEPAVFYQGAAYRRWTRAKKVLFDQWAGVAPGASQAHLWAAPGDNRRATRGLSALVRRFRNVRILDAYAMDPATMAGYLDELERDPPQLLLVYAESGYQLARHALAHGRRIEGIGAVMSSAGTLYPDMRTALEQAFAAPVFDRYGSREVGDVACECAHHHGLHVSPLTHHVELLREDGSEVGPGEVGRVVVTCLINDVMPLLRYDIGDRAAWATAPCPCGRGWPLLEAVHGRSTDHVRGVNGASVYGAWLRHLLFDEAWIAQYQWEQATLEQLQLRLVPRADEGAPRERAAALEARLLPALRERLGDSTVLSVECVEAIPPSASGKHLYVISQLDED